jgi:hypothetical protein
MRFKKSFQPNENRNEYTPDSYFTINLPRGILDLHSFTLNYKANPANYKHTNVTQTIRKTFPADTAITPATDIITIVGHGWAEGQIVRYSNKGNANIQNLANNTDYYVRNPIGNTFQLSAGETSAILDINVGTGTHELSQTIPLAFNRVVRRFFPRASSSIISELSIKINDQDVQNTKEYNMLFNILSDIKNEHDPIDSTVSESIQEHYYVSNNGIIKSQSRIQALTKPAGNTDKYYPSGKKAYFIDKWLGFLNEGNRFFDARDKDIKIIIKLAPASILYRGINSLDVASADYVINNEVEYDPDYVVSDIIGAIDVLDELPYEINESFEYNDYTYSEGGHVNSRNEVTTALETYKPVNWLLGTFCHIDRNKDQELILQHCHTQTARYGELIKDTLTINDINASTPNSGVYSYDIAKYQKKNYLLNSSIYFVRGCGISTSQFKLNNYDITPLMDPLLCLSTTKQCFQTDYKRIQNIYNFETQFFANAISIENNTQDYKRFDWNVSIDPKKYSKVLYPMLFCCFKNKL